MIERVAKAIATALGYEAGDWRDFELHARAALGEVDRAREEAMADAEKPNPQPMRVVK